jgi:hypothetical protein
MIKKTFQNLFIFFLLICATTAVAQNTHEINIAITDTVIIRKKIKKSYKYAIKVNAEITIPNLQDSLILYSFNKYVASPILISQFISARYKETTMGLTYIIEDKNDQIIVAHTDFVSYVNPKIEFKQLFGRLYVTPKLKIKRRLLSIQEEREYALAKYVINKESHNLALYPLLGEYHWDLPKGEYYLYFVYSYNKIPPSSTIESNKLCDSKIFRGWIISNKVKLLVE